MSGKRNVSVCRGQELANALYFTMGFIWPLNYDVLVFAYQTMRCVDSYIYQICQIILIDQHVSMVK